MSYQLVPNIELLFTEAGPDHADRFRAAADAGFDAVELWSTFDKDLDALAEAADDTGASRARAEPATWRCWPRSTPRQCNASRAPG
jgi:hydroxypyruvate isomerase